MDAFSGNSPKSERYCSVLISDLPQDWFLLEEDGKRDRLGNANILKISCCDASKKSAVVRVRFSGAQAQRVVAPPATSAVFIEDEKATLSLTLKNAQDKDFFEQMVKQFNLEQRDRVGNTYTIIGSLDMIADFRLALEKKIMAARADSPVATRDNDVATAATGTLNSENAGASATGMGHPTDKTTLSDDTHGWDRLPDRFNCNTLLHIVAVVKPNGVKINVHDGIVLVQDKRSSDNFYELYDTLTRQKIYSERLAIPAHMSIPYLLEELELLKQKHNKSGFVVMENSSEVCLVSTSTRQMDSFAVCVKDLLSTISYQLPGGRVLKLLKRNIVTEEVDIIVNAANDRLDHGGGVAAAINDESGGEVQRYSNQFMRKRNYKPLKVGEVAITEAGGFLKCQKVFHAVGPEKHRHRDCQGILKKLVHTILNEGERVNLKSVALPAISTGIFGVSKDLVAQCFLSEIPTHRFKKSPPIIGDIRIVIIDEPTFSCFRKHFQNMLLGGPVSVPFNKSRSVPMSGHSNDRDNPVVSYAAVASERSDSERLKTSRTDDRRNHDHDPSKHHGKRSGDSPDKSDKEKIAKVHGHGSNASKESRKEKSEGMHVDVKGKSSSDEGSDPKALSCGSDGKIEATIDTTDSREHDYSESPHSLARKGSDNFNTTSKNGDSDECFREAMDNGDPDKRPSEDSSNETSVAVVNQPDLSAEEPASPEPDIATTGQGSSRGETVGSMPPPCGSTSPITCNSPPRTCSTSAGSLPKTMPSMAEISTTHNLSGISRPSNTEEPPSLEPIISTSGHEASGRGETVGLVPLITASTSPSRCDPPPGICSTSTSSLPKTMTAMAEIAVTHNLSDFSQPSNTVQCCACLSFTVAKQIGCHHFKCQDCLTVPYLCPVCNPVLPRHGTPQQSTISHRVLPTSLPGYLNVRTIEIQFKFPGSFEGGYVYSMNTLVSYLPNNNEGQEVLKLFLEAYKTKPMYCIFQSQGRLHILMAHSYFKIYQDRGGLWGYPDEHYLAKVKRYLESCLMMGTVN